MAVQWEEPSETVGDGLRARHVEMKSIVEELKKKPGQWALLQVHETPRKARSQASNINTGNIAAMRGCRATAQMGKVYVQWPDKHPADPPGLVSHDELREFIGQLGIALGPGELAESLRMTYDIYPRGHKP